MRRAFQGVSWNRMGKKFAIYPVLVPVKLCLKLGHAEDAPGSRQYPGLPEICQLSLR